MVDLLDGVYTNAETDNESSDSETLRMTDRDIDEQERMRSLVGSLVQNINDCVAIDKELEESVMIKTLRAALDANARDAVKLLADIDVTDTKAVLQLKAICYCNQFFEGIIIGMRKRATDSAAKLKDLGV